MAFIPVDKMKQLREAAANGDKLAKKILHSHMMREDYSQDFDEFFKPKPDAGTVTMAKADAQPEIAVEEMKEADVGTGNPDLDKFLSDNGIKIGDDSYNDAVEEYYMEFPEQRPADAKPRVQEPVANVEEEQDVTKEIGQGIIDLISKCDKFMLNLMQNNDIDDTTKKGAMTSLDEIKSSLFDAADKVKKIKQSFDKKQEENLQNENVVEK